MRLGVAAARRRRCGVSDFAQRLVAASPPEIEVTWIDYPDRDASGAWRRAARAADGLDLVHLHYEYGLFRTIRPYRNRYGTFLGRLRAPAVVTLHGALPRLEPRWRSGRRGASDLVRDLAYLPFFSRWERILCRGVRHWIAHGRGVHDQTAQVVGVERVTYMPHPVPEVESMWRPEARREKVIVTPGFIKAHKGYHELVRALKDGASWSWIIAGGSQDRTDEEYLHQLREVLAARGVGDRVRITGYLDRSDMEATLCAAAMAVFPYTDVTGSGSVTWAIGCGVPVVTTDLPEFRAMQSGGAGIELLPREAPDRWADTLDRLWREPARLEALASRNRDYACANGFGSCARAHAEIFARVVREAGA
jgi:glycosyltransferase involved in cell wall biosynthesis